MHLLQVSSLLLCLGLNALAQDVIVKLPNGTLKGRLEYSQRKNVRFYAFQQIPYAKPPLGELRFKEPQPADPWTGTLDASKVTEKVCIQLASWGNFTGQSEDCLYLNVYTPSYPSTNNSYPIIFYIYGGGYNSGYAGFYQAGPHYLIEGGVIVVTITYRVGPFGFLSTGDQVVPGNNGLKDQLLALEWVRDNIKYFGGDPNKITLMGGSAGAASSTLHLMSQKSKGLFRAVIANSGSLLCPWSYQDAARAKAYQLATAINPAFNKTATSKDLVAFLRNATAQQINDAAKTFQDGFGGEQIVQGFTWAPVIENKTKNAFITEPMYAALEGGRLARVPILIGINSEEALDRITDVWFPQTLKNFDANLTGLVNRNMHLLNAETKLEVGKEIRKIYANGSLADNLAGGIRYYSDTSFTRPIIRHAHMQSIYSTVYFYQFSYHGKLGGNRPYLEGADRVAHSEEGNYIWCYGNASYLEYYPAEDVQTSERFRTLLTNFVKYLNPTPKPIELLNNITWPAVKNYDFKYININNTLTIQTDPKNSTYPKWVELYEKYALQPLITY